MVGETVFTQSFLYKVFGGVEFRAVGEGNIRRMFSGDDQLAGEMPASRSMTMRMNSLA